MNKDPSLSNSFFVIESMIQIMRLNLLDVSSSPTWFIISPIPPGSICAILLRGPIFMMLFICDCKSFSVNLPSWKFFIVSAWSKSNVFTCSINPWISPIPKSFDTNCFAVKLSKSWMCSPVPMKMIGVLLAATAEMAPPPLAWPSIFVRMIAPKLLESLNARDQWMHRAPSPFD